MYDQSDKIETNQTLYQQCHCFTFIEAKLDKSHVRWFIPIRYSLKLLN